METKALKDILLLADFIQTGGLEVFHGTLAKKYLPKSQHYSYNGMKCCMQVAIIDNNSNAGREVAPTEAVGAGLNVFILSSRKSGWPNPFLEEKSYQFVDDLNSSKARCN